MHRRKIKLGAFAPQRGGVFLCWLAALIIAPLCVVAQAPGEDQIFFADFNAGIYRGPSDGSTAPTLILESNGSFPAGNPEYLQITSTHIYWGDFDGTVNRAEHDGSNPQCLLGPTSRSDCLTAVDLTEFDEPRGLAIDPSTNAIYVRSRPSGVDERIIKIDAQKGTILDSNIYTSSTPGTFSLAGMALDVARQNLYLVDLGINSNAIVAIDLNNGKTVSPIYTDLGSLTGAPIALTVDTSTVPPTLFWTSIGGSLFLIHSAPADPTGTITPLFSAADSGGAFVSNGIAIDRAGGFIYWTEFNSGIRRGSILGNSQGAPILVYSNLDEPQDIDFLAKKIDPPSKSVVPEAPVVTSQLDGTVEIVFQLFGKVKGKKSATHANDDSAGSIAQAAQEKKKTPKRFYDVKISAVDTGKVVFKKKVQKNRTVVSGLAPGKDHSVSYRYVDTAGKKTIKTKQSPETIFTSPGGS